MSNFDLPPWLRDDNDDPKPTQPPPKKGPSADDPTPWLFGIEEDNEDKTIEQGGRLSADFLAQGDFLIDTVETDLTYDEWMARQNESKRVKDIEEEIPDFSETEEMMRAAASLDTGEKLPGTAQLPDWFLGLEELKQEEEPDWMQTGETFMQAEPEKPAADIPSWMGNTDEFEGTLPSFSGFGEDPSASRANVDSGIDDFFASLSAPKTAEDVPSFEDELPSEFANAFGDAGNNAYSDDFFNTQAPAAEDELPSEFANAFGDAGSDAYSDAFSDDFFNTQAPSNSAPAKTDNIPDWFTDDAPAQSAAWDDTPNFDQPASWDEPSTFGDTGILKDEETTFGEPIAYGEEPSIDDIFAQMLGGDVVNEANFPTEAPLNVDFNVPAVQDAPTNQNVDALIASGPDESWFDDEDEPEPQTFNTGMLSDLNHFFDDVAAHRGDPPLQEETSEPDFDWFLNQQTQSAPPHELKDLAAAAKGAIPPPADPTPAQAESMGADTLSWLSEINNIVNSVARGDDPLDDDGEADFFGAKDEIPPTPDFGQLGIEQQEDADIGSVTMKFSQSDLDYLRDQRRSTSEERAIKAAEAEAAEAKHADEFQWSDGAAIEPEPEDDAGLSWLQSMDADTWQDAAQSQADEAPKTPDVERKGMLSGLTPPPQQAEPEATASGIVFPSSASKSAPPTIDDSAQDDLDAFESPDFVDGLVFDPQSEAEPEPAQEESLSDWESLVRGAAEQSSNDFDDDPRQINAFDDETLTSADDALDFLSFSDSLVEEAGAGTQGASGAGDFSFSDEDFPTDLPSFDDLRFDSDKPQAKQQQSDDFSFDLPDLSSLDFGGGSAQNSSGGDDFSFDDFSFDDLPPLD